MRLVMIIIISLTFITCGYTVEVEVVKLGNGELAPVLDTDATQTQHLIYFKGEAKAGDIYYRRRASDKDAFSDPVLVNSIKNSAMVIGGVRAPDMAVSSDGVVHVAWMSNTGGKQSVMYTHSNVDGSKFSKQQNLMQRSDGLDAGVSVAAFEDKKVYVVWTAHGKTNAEKDRLLFVAYSKNAGKSFSKESPINGDRPGICACCGIDAGLTVDGEIMILYRSAGAGARDMTLLQGKPGKSLTYPMLDQWNANACPMSSMSVVGGKEPLMTWQTKEQVFYTSVDEKGVLKDKTTFPGFGKTRKHSTLARNNDGNMCLAWTEGVGWNKGGKVLWQVQDANGVMISDGQKNDLSAWSKPAVAVKNNRGFLLVY